jgi:hypothetical protein
MNATIVPESVPPLTYGIDQRYWSIYALTDTPGMNVTP